MARLGRIMWSRRGKASQPNAACDPYDRKFFALPVGAPPWSVACALVPGGIVHVLDDGHVCVKPVARLPKDPR